MNSLDQRAEVIRHDVDAFIFTNTTINNLQETFQVEIKSLCESRKKITEEVQNMRANQKKILEDAEQQKMKLLQDIKALEDQKRESQGNFLKNIIFFIF